MLPLLLVPVLIVMLPESIHFLLRKEGKRNQIRKLLSRIDPNFSAPADAQFVTTEPTASGMAVAHLFRSGRGIGTLLLWIVFFMNLLDFFFLQSWLPTILTDSGLNTGTAVLIATLVSVGGIACGVLSGPLMDRFGAYYVLTGLYISGTVFMALMGLGPASLLALIALTFAAGFCVSGGQKSVNALAVIFYPPPMRSTGVGWALGIGRAGAIVGPLMGGWLMARGWSNSTIFEFAALPMLCAAVVVFTMGLRYSSRHLGVVKDEKRQAIA